LVVPVSEETLADFALEIMAAQTDGQLRAILRPFEVLAVTAESQSGEWPSPIFIGIVTGC